MFNMALSSSFNPHLFACTCRFQVRNGNDPIIMMERIPIKYKEVAAKVVSELTNWCDFIQAGETVYNQVGTTMSGCILHGIRVFAHVHLYEPIAQKTFTYYSTTHLEKNADVEGKLIPKLQDIVDSMDYPNANRDKTPSELSATGNNGFPSWMVHV